jgi:hypothetical protein
LNLKLESETVAWIVVAKGAKAGGGGVVSHLPKTFQPLINIFPSKLLRGRGR